MRRKPKPIPAAAVLRELSPIQFKFIVDNRKKMSRTHMAKELGMLKFNLNQYLIKIYGTEAM